MRTFEFFTGIGLVFSLALNAQTTTNELTLLGEIDVPSAEGRLAWDAAHRTLYCADSIAQKTRRGQSMVLSYFSSC
jgi:hypothetical protein